MYQLALEGSRNQTKEAAHAQEQMAAGAVDEVEAYIDDLRIDSDYRGETKVILHNTTKEPFEIKKGERIAQGVIKDYYKAEFEEVEELSDAQFPAMFIQSGDETREVLSIGDTGAGTYRGTIDFLIVAFGKGTTTNIDTVRNLLNIYDALEMIAKGDALRPIYKEMRNR